MTNEPQMNDDNNVFEFSQPPEEEVEKKATHFSGEKKKKNLKAFVICMVILIAAPLTLIIFNQIKSPSTDSSQARSASRPPLPRALSQNTPPSVQGRYRYDTAASNDSTPSLENLLSDSDLQRINSYPKTAAERQVEQKFAAKLHEAEASLTAREKRLDNVIASLDRVARILVEHASAQSLNTVEMDKALSELKSTSKTLTAAADTFNSEKEKFGYVASSGSGIYQAPRVIIPLAGYEIRSIVGATAIVAPLNNPSAFTSLSVGSTLPGHGPLLKIIQTDDLVELQFQNGVIGMY